ncbi:hypothetical protein BGZ79_005210, partial [Entomortierella chlamydospora]
MHSNLVRQTRSNFDNITTFGLHAAIHPRLNRTHTRPVTLFDLWSFKARNNGWSGIKLAAYIIYNLYEASEPLLKSKVQEYLTMIRGDKDGNVDDDDSNSGIGSSLTRLVKVMKDQEARPVSLAVNRELKGLV